MKTRTPRADVRGRTSVDHQLPAQVVDDLIQRLVGNALVWMAAPAKHDRAFGSFDVVERTKNELGLADARLAADANEHAAARAAACESVIEDS